MGRHTLSDGHKWRVHEVRLDGQTFVHRQCLVCRRDLVIPPGGGEWKAVHLGGITFDFLDDEITQRWAAESCPGMMLAHEANSQRMLRQLTQS